MNAHVRETAEGVVFEIKVRAAARRRQCVGWHAGVLRVDVTAAPERGKANEEVVELLAATLDVPRSRLEIVRGAVQPRKQVLVRGWTAAQLSEALNSGPAELSP